MARTLEMFATALRSGVELEDLTSDLLGVVEERMRPAHVSLWLRTHGAVVIVDGHLVGKTTFASTTQLVVEMDTMTVHLPLRVVGVRNPDGTGALSPRVEQDTGATQSGGNNTYPTPAADPTPTPKDGHAHGGSSSSKTQ
jgi:hypothetical protein